VLKDMWGLSSRQMQETARWAAKAMVDAALSEARNETIASGAKTGGAQG